MIYIILDTNILHIRNFNDYYNFELNTSYTDLQGKIELRDLSSSFKILIPDLVFKELQKQKLKHYEDDSSLLNSLKEKFSNFQDIHFDLPSNNNYDEFLEQRISEFKTRNSIETIKTTNEEKNFARIIDKAINKNPPFEGNEKQSDKGFKDALIWESILNYAQNNPGEYYFYTRDKGFQNKLIPEFMDLTTNSTMTFIDEKKKNILNELIDTLSDEKISNERFRKVNNEITKILPELKENLKEKVFNSFSVNNIPNYRLETFDFPEYIYELTDLSNSSFTFTCYCSLTALKTGTTISMNIDLNFLVNTVINRDDTIKSIVLENLDARTQEDDELILNVKSFEINFETDKNYYNDENEENSKHTLNKNVNQKIENKELDEQTKSIINNVLSDFKINFYKNETLEEFYNIIANRLSLDWVHFESKISAMNISVKKFLNKNKVSEATEISNNLVDTLKNHYSKYM